MCVCVCICLFTKIQFLHCSKVSVTKYNTINIVNTFFKINKIEVIIVVICVRKSHERELHVREVCNVHYTYGKTV